MPSRLIQRLLREKNRPAQTQRLGRDGQTLRAVEAKFLASPAPPLSSLEPRIVAYGLGLTWTDALEEAWRKRHRRCRLCRAWLPADASQPCPACSVKA